MAGWKEPAAEPHQPQELVAQPDFLMAQLENSYGWMKNPYGRMKMDFPMAQPPYGRPDAYGRIDDFSYILIVKSSMTKKSAVKAA